MFEIIIWIIIICAIYGKGKKREQQRAERNAAQPNMQYRTKNQNAPSNVQYKNRTQTQGYPQSKHSQADMAAKQRELKQRLQQKYGVQDTAADTMQSISQQQENARTVQPKPADIFSRAAANAAGYEAEMPENRCLLDEVNDLILMGYQPDLTFSRDFVAEGIQMLNSYGRTED